MVCTDEGWIAETETSPDDEWSVAGPSVLGLLWTAIRLAQADAEGRTPDPALLAELGLDRDRK